ncbi:hypothetical protein ACIP5Y_10190 [Nocardia sp. NPDC088792]
MTAKTTHVDPEELYHNPAITVVSTAGHARPGALVEIDAVAIIPE